MLKQVTITQLKYSHLSVIMAIGAPLTGVEYITRSVQGITPVSAEISQETRNGDGNIFVNSRVGSRSIQIVFDYRPNYALNVKAEDLRYNLYSKLSPGSNVEMEFLHHDGKIRKIKGHIEALESDIFGKESLGMVSVLCSEPFFYDERMIRESVGPDHLPIKIQPSEIGDIPIGFQLDSYYMETDPETYSTRVSIVQNSPSNYARTTVGSDTNANTRFNPFTSRVRATLETNRKLIAKGYIKEGAIISPNWYTYMFDLEHGEVSDEDNNPWGVLDPLTSGFTEIELVVEDHSDGSRLSVPYGVTWTPLYLGV